MPTTTEWWSIDGVSLHEYGWNVATVGGSRYDIPVRRGNNITLAKRPGQIFRPGKVADSRTVELIMWVLGVDPVTGASVADPTLRWNDSWEYLRRLVWKPSGTQVNLTRRWNLTVNNVKTLVSATAKAEISDSMAPTMTGRHRADFTMRLLLADPYFYGDQQEVTFQVGQTKTIHNPGSDIAAFGFFDVDLTGPLVNPVVTNNSFNLPVKVGFKGTIPAGVTVRFSIPGFTVRTVVGYEIIGIVNLVGNLVTSGARFWMGLAPGNNDLTFTTASGTGSALVRFRPPYI